MTTPPTAGAISFQADYGINPASGARGGSTPDGSSPPGGLGPGSLVTCVRPVTYWIDDLARLRMWRGTPGSATGGATTRITSAGSLPGGTPIDPINDLVITEGIEELQIALFMSRELTGALGGTWAFAGSGDLSTEAQLAETRAVRITAVVRSPHKEDSERRSARPPAIENRTLPTVATVGCQPGNSCFDPRYHRKVVTFTAELRNLRIFDLLSNASRTTGNLWSYPP